MLDAQPFSGNEPKTTTSSAAKQNVHPQTLSLGFGAADQRADKQAGRQPGRGDPKNSQLHVPGASDAVGQPLGKGKAVKGISLDAVVRRDDAQQHLHENQCGNDPKIFERGLLRRRGLPTAQRIDVGRHQRFFIFLSRRIPPDHCGDARQQHDDADAGPNHGFARGPVSDQRFVRPIVCVADVIVWPIGDGGPRGPKEERTEVSQAVLIGDGSRGACA